MCLRVGADGFNVDARLGCGRRWLNVDFRGLKSAEGKGGVPETIRTCPLRP
jgi:hypothetical protein